MSMPITSRWRLLAASLTSLAAGQLPAPAQETQPYEPIYRAWFEVGGLFSQNTELHSFPGVAGDSTVRLHPGIRLGLGSGYQFTPYFTLDWEVSVLASSVDNASGLAEMDADITQVPFLLNAVFQYENQTGFTPFVGLGAGMASTAINVDEARSGTAAIDGSDYDFVFAWQALAGLKYEFRKGLALGILYKYLWTSDAEWELDNDISGGDDHLEIDGIQSHAILAFLSYRF